MLNDFLNWLRIWIVHIWIKLDPSVKLFSRISFYGESKSCLLHNSDMFYPRDERKKETSTIRQELLKNSQFEFWVVRVGVIVQRGWEACKQGDLNGGDIQNNRSRTQVCALLLVLHEYFDIKHAHSDSEKWKFCEKILVWGRTGLVLRFLPPPLLVECTTSKVLIKGTPGS